MTKLRIKVDLKRVCHDQTPNKTYIYIFKVHMVNYKAKIYVSVSNRRLFKSYMMQKTFPVFFKFQNAKKLFIQTKYPMVRDSILLNPENITKNNSLSTLIVFFLFYRNKDNQYVCIFNSNKQQLWTYVRNSKSSVQQKKKKIRKTCRKSFPSHSTWYMR